MIYTKTQQRPKPFHLFRFELGDKVIVKVNSSIPNEYDSYKGIIIKRFLDFHEESYHVECYNGTIRADVKSIYKLVP